MSAFNWRAIIEKIQNGEPVEQAVANRALVALADRTDWLKNRIEGLDTTSGRLTLSSVSISSEVSGGDWVYYDRVDDNYKRAIASLTFNEELNTYLPDESSMVAGLVVDKISASLAVVLIIGEGVDLPGEPDIATMQDLIQDGETFAPGRHFLSNVTPGKMTRFPSGGPLIPLGVFSEESSTIQVSVRDVFDSHFHRRFELHAEPAASQNFDQTGWSDDGMIAWVEHYYLSGQHSVIALAHRRDQTQAPNTAVQRVDFQKDGTTGDLEIIVHQDVDYDDPTSLDSNYVVKVVPWPEYGEEIAINWPDDGIETDLVIAFIRRDWNNASRYNNTLAVDIAGLGVSDTSGTWKVFLPKDYSGWANANPFRGEVPADARLRYCTEGHLDLFAAFPPVPVEGAIVYKDGLQAVDGTDYTFNYWDLFWEAVADNGDDTSEFPWPWDFDRTSTYTGSKNVQITFSENPLGPTESVVKCLASASELLEITQLGGSQKASTGKLQLALKLALAIKDADPILADTVLASIDEESRFVLGTSVAELVAGPNVKLVKLDKNGNEDLIGPFTGKVRVEAVLPDLQGESVGVALFNAKESEKNGIIFTEFLPPASAKTAMAARIKIPNFDRGSNHIRLRLFSKFLGTAASVSATNGIFRVEYRIVRPGINISTDLAAAARVEGWKVPIEAGYTAFELLDEELPVYGPSGSETFEKEPASSVYNLFADDQLEPNDIVSVKIERMDNGTPFSVGDTGSLSANTLGGDDYDGNIGIVGLRWTIELN